MNRRSLLLALAGALVVVFALSSQSFAAKAKPIFYCGALGANKCHSTAQVNAKRTQFTKITIKAKCVRQNGVEIEDFNATFQKSNVKLTGKKKNKFKIKGDVTLIDDSRDGPYSFPYSISGTVKHGKSISGKFTVTGVPTSCANVASGTFSLKKF